MAKNNNLGDFLTDLANTLRTKKGTTDLINPQDFSSEILSIAGGIEDVETSSEMDAKLAEANVGKIYRYTGTTGDYVNGDLYEVAENTPSGFTVTITYGVAEVANDGATKIKFGTPPTSGNDYDYVTSYGYDTPRCLYDKLGNRITSPVTIEDVATCYIFHDNWAGAYRIVEGSASISGNSYEETSYGSDATDYGQLIRKSVSDFSNPDVVTLTSDVTLKIMATED